MKEISERETVEGKRVEGKRESVWRGREREGGTRE